MKRGRLLHRASGAGDAVAWLAIVVSVAVVYSVPAIGISVAYLLGGTREPLQRNCWRVVWRTWRRPLLPSLCWLPVSMTYECE